MQRRFEQSARGAVAPLALLFAIGLIGPAQAAGLSTDGATRPSAAQCGDTGEKCTRIRGHIQAGSDFAGGEAIGGRLARFGPPPPFVAGLGAAGQAAADTVNRGLYFLQVSHDQTGQ